MSLFLMTCPFFCEKAHRISAMHFDFFWRQARLCGAFAAWIGENYRINAIDKKGKLRYNKENSFIAGASRRNQRG